MTKATTRGAETRAEPAAVQDDSRERLVEGLSLALAEKGYAATTIADIVKNARVSKRTFYEHFKDKEECFLASFRSASDKVLMAIAASVDEGRPWRDQIRLATRAYVRVLEQNATLTRTFLLEIHAAGPNARKARRDVLVLFANQLRDFVNTGRKKHPEVRHLSAPLALAIVGGVNELLISALEQGGGESLKNIENTAAELLRAVLFSSDAE